MSESSYIFDVDQFTLTSVMEHSQQVPVLIDFWADWCEPCRILTPLLTKLAHEYQGGFILAKVNADSEQELAAHLQIRSLPTVMVVWQGQIVEQLVGVQPESAYREIIDRFGARAPAGDNLQEQVDMLWNQGQHQQAVRLLEQMLLKEPDSIELKVSLAEKLLHLGYSEDARNLLQSVPEAERDKQPTSRLFARLQFADMAEGAPDAATLDEQINNNPADSAARQQRAARYVLAGDYEGALQQFMAIMQRDPQFEEGAGRKGLIAVFEILGNEDPLVVTYRRRMFSLLH